MSKLFDWSEIETPIDNESQFKCEKFIDKHCEKIENVKYLIKKFPARDEIYFLWTLNSFNAFTFIPYVIKEFGVIDEIIVSTYSINRRIVDSLIRYVDKGNIKNVVISVSDSLKMRMPKIADHLTLICEQRKNIKINFVWNHSKICLMKTGYDFFIVEGSGNWSENAQYEQYIFLNSVNVYNFRKNCIDGIK